VPDDTLDPDDKIVQLFRNAEEVQDDLPVPPQFSDSALAVRFVNRHGPYTRYVAAWGKWMFWSGKCWEPDTTLWVASLAHNICREAATETDDKRMARSVASAKTVNAVMTLARSDPAIAADVEQWDADPWILCTPNGVVNLRDGKVRPCRPEDYSTRSTIVSPDGECPTWLEFLAKVTNGDVDLQRYLRRMCGYALTGVTVEHALFFLYGEGGNGKSTFVDAISGVMGTYHTVAQIETFTANPTDRHPTDLAALRGARLVTATETEEGRRWAESRIKSLTGGDKVSARFMRQDFFEYVPRFKLMIFGNHKPGLRTVDEAIRRRMNLLPFVYKILAGEKDKNFGDKLKEEWPGILKWMIGGCVEWQASGLEPPASVIEATDKYLDDEDTFKTWFAECCIADVNGFTPLAWLFNSWKTWAKRANEHEGSQKKFSQRLESEGFVSEKKRPKVAGEGPQPAKWGFHGVRLSVTGTQDEMELSETGEPGGGPNEGFEGQNRISDDPF
jgi:putative DNA primase/helicase